MMRRGVGAWDTARGRALLLLLLLPLAACSLTTSRATQTPDMTSVPATPFPGDAPDAPDSAPLIVAWAAGGDLFTWRSSDPMPRRIASGGVIRPFVSPDGAWVAYLRGPGGDPRDLWLSDPSKGRPGIGAGEHPEVTGPSVIRRCACAPLPRIRPSRCASERACSCSA